MIQKRYIGTTVALIFVIGLFVYSRYLEKPKLETEEITLISLPAQQIDHIKISEAEKTLVLEKSNNGIWQIASNVSLKVDEGKIKTLIDTLSDLKVTQLPMNTSDEPPLKAFELEPPNRSVKIHTNLGSEKTILIGRKSPIGFKFYVKIPESKQVYLLPEYNADLITTNEQQFKRAASPETTPSAETQPQ